MTTQAAELIKLKTPGDSRVILVESCAPLTIGEYPEVEFVGTDHASRRIALRVPQKSVDRQLERLSLTYAKCVGLSLIFSRDPNAKQPTKPYWGINVNGGTGDLPSGAKGNGTSGAQPSATAGVGQQAASEVTAPVTAPAPAPTKKEKRSAIYLAQTQWVLGTIKPLYVEAGITVTANDVHAMVAVLFIAETRNE